MRRTTKKKRFVRGRDRTIGNYLRYTGPRPEQKFLDSTVTDVVVATSAAVVISLNVIPQGTTASERIGRKITITKLKLRWVLNLPNIQDATALTSGDVIRVMVFVDKQTNGAGAIGSDILKFPTDFQSYRLLSNVGRFDILYDKFHSLQYLTGAGLGGDIGSAQLYQGGVKYHYKFSKSMTLPIEYSGMTGAIDEIQSNNIGILLISSNGNGGFDGDVRIRYTDF